VSTKFINHTIVPYAFCNLMRLSSINGLAEDMVLLLVEAGNARMILENTSITQ
jgi:hypothetical protein